MKQILPLLLSTFLACIATTLFSSPGNLSVSAFKEFKERVKIEVNKQVEEEFKKKEEGINKLSHPFKEGEEVSVTVAQGDPMLAIGKKQSR